MKISEIIMNKYKLRMPPTVYYDLLSDVVEVEEEQEPKTGHCKDCKWWKDNNGTYRRGVKAESQCPINRKEVYEGNGYCFLYEPQESDDT